MCLSGKFTGRNSGKCVVPTAYCFLGQEQGCSREQGPGEGPKPRSLVLCAAWPVKPRPCVDRNRKEHGGSQALHGTSTQGKESTSIFPAGQGWFWACVCGMYCSVSPWLSQRVALTSLGSLKLWYRQVHETWGRPACGEVDFHRFNLQQLNYSSLLLFPQPREKGQLLIK